MISLKQAHKKFTEHLSNSGKSSATVIAYDKDIEQLTEHITRNGVEIVTQIRIEHLQMFVKDLGNKGYTTKSISRKINAIRTFFGFLYNQGHIGNNIALNLHHPKVVNKAPRILSKTEYMALKGASQEDLRTYAMVETLLQTGITISELAEMKVDDIHIEGETGSLDIPARNSKKARRVPLNKAVVQAIQKYMKEGRSNIEGSEHVFVTKTGKPLLVRNIRATINRYFKKAGIENAKVNDLRHTFVAHHLKRGVNIAHLARILGHKRIATTEKYLQHIEDAPKEYTKTTLEIL